MKNSKNIPATVQSLLAKKLQSAVRTSSSDVLCGGRPDGTNALLVSGANAAFRHPVQRDS
ncbi:MAG: hypothetical protein NTZ35_05545 [Ignavibacteriales bacterium]|nr:hypothetical protein [Ignavibacteriales bacterium]